jgi:hypothetical protein
MWLLFPEMGAMPFFMKCCIRLKAETLTKNVHVLLNARFPKEMKNLLSNQLSLTWTAR